MTPARCSPVRRHSFARCLCLATAALMLLSSAGCSKKTPEQKIEEIRRYMRNDPFLAVIKCKNFLDEHPNSPDADNVRLMLAKCYFQKREFAQTHKCLQEIYQKNGLLSPIGFNAYVGDMQTLFQDGKTTDAIAMGKAKIKDIEAVTTATEPLKIMRTLIAEFSLMAGVKDEGRAIFKDMIEKTTDTREAMQMALEISGSLQSEGKTTQALENYCWLLDRFPKLEEDLLTTSTWIPRGQEHKPLPPSFNPKTYAEQTIVQLLESHVKLFAAKKDFGNAISVYRNYLSRHPDSILKRKLTIGMAFYLNEMGGKAEAENTYQSALKSLDDEIAKTPGARAKGELVLEKSQIYKLKKDPEGAIKLCKEYLEKYPASELQMQFLDSILATYLDSFQFDTALAYVAEVQSKSTDQKIAGLAKQRAEEIKKMKQRKEQEDAASSKTLSDAAATSGAVKSGAVPPVAPGSKPTSPTLAPKDK